METLRYVKRTGVALRITSGVDDNKLEQGDAHLPVIVGVSYDLRGLQGFVYHDPYLGRKDFISLVNWIMTCISSVAFTIDINGERHGKFRSRWWLRRGYAASPYLFTLLESLVRSAARDDGDVESIQVIKEALMEFSGAIGLIPNIDKSVFFFRSVKEPKKHKILEVLPFDVGKFPVKYLGILLLAKRLGIKEYKQLVDHVKVKIQEWKNKALSYAGRLQLIASV
ncbi:hypothetical protein Tco_0183202 [Tanacetum coccineum]